MLHRFRVQGILIILMVSLITILLFVLSKPDGFLWNEHPLHTLSQLVALVGTVFLSLTFILTSRFRQVEKMFGGLDIVYKIHHILGALSFVFLLHHPLLLAVEQLPNVSIAQMYVLPGQNMVYNFGIAGLSVMILGVVSTLFVSLPYHIWKRTHEWLGLALILSMLHVFFISSDISRFLPLRMWTLTWLVIAICSFLLKKFFYRWFAESYEYKVKQKKEFGDLVEIELVPAADKHLHFQLGQFVFLEILNNKGIGKEKHPFSIASSPFDSTITLMCKKLGDYTSKLPLLAANEPVRLYGPYGTFMEKFSMSNPAICIAAGIGITPFLSLFPQQPLPPDAQLYSSHSGLQFIIRRNSRCEAWLPARRIGGNKPRNEAILSDWRIPSTYLFHCVKNKIESPLYNNTNVSQQPQIVPIIHETMTQSRLTIHHVTETIKEWKNATYFMCGPMPMMESYRKELISLGVSPSRIIFEDFQMK